MTKDQIAVGDWVLFRGGYCRVLSIVSGRVDPICADPADIEAVNDYGDEETFGLEAVDGVIHPHVYAGGGRVCADCHMIRLCQWHAL